MFRLGGADEKKRYSFTAEFCIKKTQKEATEHMKNMFGINPEPSLESTFKAHLSKMCPNKCLLRRIVFMTFTLFTNIYFAKTRQVGGVWGRRGRGTQIKYKKS